MTAKRRPGRRPVLEGLVYNRAMCDRVRAVGKKGGTITGMALACGVRPAQLRRWARRHPEFAHAYEIARQHAQVYWERLGQAHLDDATLPFTEGVWLHFMQRFDEYQPAPRHHRFRRDISSVPDVASMMITRVVTRSRSGDAP